MRGSILAVVVAAALLVAAASIESPAAPPAVVLVPGTGGNQLEAKLEDEYHGGALYCRTFGVSYWFRLWLNVVRLVPPFTRCFAERMRLEYNGGTKQFHNPPGIETRVPGFGSTETMEYLDSNFKFLTPYMAALVKALKSKGLEPQKTLFGAPYDFRYTPGPNAADVALSYLKDLKRLIEEAYTTSGNRPVVIVAHSLGGLWMVRFLNLQRLEWRRKYVVKLVAVATPWAGSVHGLRLFASGYAEGTKYLDPLVLRSEQRSLESNLYLLPAQKVFGNRTLIVGSSRNYSSFDLEAFFQDIGFEQGFRHYASRVPELYDNLVAPMVPVTLVFGTGLDTPELLFYNSSSNVSGGSGSCFDYEPEMGFGDGDGTMNLRSLTWIASEWERVEDQDVKVIAVHGKSQSSVIQDQDALDKIVDEVLSTKFVSDL